MLLELRLEALATVDTLAWEPGAGLNVVSGETGAGKSILVGAVALLFGARAGAEIVRTGSRSARVEGRFDASGVEGLDGAEWKLEDLSDLVLRREISSDGRSRYQLNGRALAQVEARELGRHLVDLLGQHEHQSLLRPETQLQLLDRTGNHEAAIREEHTAAARRQEAREALRRFEEERAAAESRRDFWEFQLKDLEDAKLRPGEDAELERERLRLAHAERLGEAVQEAARLLEDDENGALGRVAAARHALQRVREWDEALGPMLDGLDAAALQLSEAGRELGRRSAALEADPERLREVEERLDLLRRVKKRYGGSLEAAIALREELARRLAELESPEETAGRIGREAQAADAAWWEARSALHRARLGAGRKLTDALRREWREVGLAGARFEVALEPEPAEHALDAAWPHRVEFLVSTNPGEDLRPLAKVASGGEISRLMLGLKSVLVEEDPVSTLLFDEIDVGIGGQVAEVVAAKLRKLSRRHQVICITHLPALAARADHHFRVDKSVRAGRTFTRVEALDAAGRVEELSRMLAGSRVSDVTRRQARELLARGSE